MKRILLFVSLFVGLFSAAHAEVPDSIARKMTLLAARDDTEALRPLYRQYGTQLEPSARLFCNLAFARERHDDRRLVECVDSLLEEYPRTLPVNTRYTLSVVKAGAMVRLQRFEKLQDFCTRELKRYRNRRSRRTQYNTLLAFRDKARRLLDTVSVRGRVMRMVEADDVPGLRLLADSLGTLDPYARRMAQLTLLKAGVPDGRLAALADSLLTSEADSLDRDGRERCLRAGVHDLFWQGCWTQLADFCRRWEPVSEGLSGWLQRYARIATQFEGHDSVRVERPARTCYLPTTLEWPMMTSIEVNGHTFDDMVVETGYPVTMISQAEADRCGLRVLSDTLLVGSMFGPLKVRPALIDRLSLGEITLTNVPVYVATSDNPSLTSSFSGLLGTSALARLGVIDIEPERLVFPYRAEADAGAEPNMRLSGDGNLQVEADHQGHRQLFALDTGQSACIFSTYSYPRATTDVRQLRLTVAGQTLTVPYAELSDMHAYDHEGVLGVPFLKSFKKLRMDFRHMRLTASGVQPFHYRDIEQWINDGNLFCLDRNLDAISVVTDDVGSQIAEIFSLYGKNAPEELCEAIDELFSSDSNSREASTLNMMRLQALEDMGRWSEAGLHIRNMLDHGYYNPDTRDTLVAKMNLYTTEMAHVQPLSINMGSLAAELQWQPGQKGQTLPLAELTVNDRQADFLFDPTDKYCVITDKAARRLKLHPFTKPFLWQGQKAHLVVIPSLRIGAIEVNNLVCVVVPGKKKQPLVLGHDLWRHFAALELDNERLIMHSESPYDGTRSAPMRLDNGHLYVSARRSQGEELILKVTSTANDLSEPVDGSIRVGNLTLDAARFPRSPHGADAFSSGCVSWPWLAGQNSHVVLDFTQMMCWRR